MTASGKLANGVSVYNSTIATASTAELVSFSDRYGYVTVTNLGTTDPIYVTSNGTTATIGGTDFVALPGETILVANGLPYWDQSSRVIPAGVNANALGTGSTNAADPATVTPMSSLAGQASNPGTSISLISAGLIAYSVSAAG